MPPIVSIGVPVYNGENFVGDALRSISEQTFSDYEVVICDNASTDRTSEICREFADRDARFRYYRHAKNLGAGPNFNATFERARGRYFKWHGHDDMLTPQYLAKTVAALEADPAAVLCHSRIRLIDARGDTLDEDGGDLPEAGALRASDRFRGLATCRHQCLALDGVIRTAALAGTPLIASFHGSDRTLLAELALRGKLIEIPEAIFITRDHPSRYRRAAVNPELRLAFHDPSLAGHRSVATWDQYREYWAMIARNVTDPDERRRCRKHLLRWWFVNWNAARVGVDLVALVAPGFLHRAERFKQRVFSPEPGPDANGKRAKRG